MKILWADDQEDAVRLFASLLVSHKCDVILVPDGKSALVKLQHEAFDLAIVDLSMPPGDWGGLWFMEQLLKLDLRLPVIVVSGQGSQSETIKAMRLGASDYIVKEMVEIELLDRIDAVLQGNSQKLLSEGESDTVEFKASARWDLKAATINKEITNSVIRTVAGFLNSDRGGHLFIGVCDDKSLYGLASDYKTLGTRQNRDGFENWLYGRMTQAFGNHVGSWVRLSFCQIDGVDVCHVSVWPSSTPVYVDDNGVQLMYLRCGNSTRCLDARDAVCYSAQRWPRG